MYGQVVLNTYQLSGSPMNEQLELPLFEEWRDIPGYEGIYQVSDQGRVKSFKMYRLYPFGNILKPSLSRKGYLVVYLYRNNHPYRTSVHRLMMLTFVGPCPTGHNVNHKDGNKRNNTLPNLEYTTYSENNRHAREILGVNVGERSSQSKLTTQQVIEIRKLNAQGINTVKLGRLYGVEPNTIASILKRKTWKHVPPSSNDEKPKLQHHLSAEQIQEIQSLHNSGLGYRKIAKQLGIPRQTIGSLIRKMKRLNKV